MLFNLAVTSHMIALSQRSSNAYNKATEKYNMSHELLQQIASAVSFNHFLMQTCLFNNLGQILYAETLNFDWAGQCFRAARIALSTMVRSGFIFFLSDADRV